MSQENVELVRTAIEAFNREDAGDTGVVAVLRVAGRGRTSGAMVERGLGMTYRLHGGRIRSMRAYLDSDDALESMGLARSGDTPPS